VMFDGLHPDDEAAPRPLRPAHEGRPQADREVPLMPAAPAMAASLHAWLDGEGSESAARREAGARDVELWKRVDADLARCRQRRTPAGLHASIMAAIR
jgi:hypothetical protein